MSNVNVRAHAVNVARDIAVREAVAARDAEWRAAVERLDAGIASGWSSDLRNGGLAALASLLAAMEGK